MVHATAVEGLKGGRLRVSMIGGGRNAFIGAGRAPSATAKLTPNVLDGARGVAFIEAAVRSSRNDGAWTSARVC
jgi:hypothetical protein